jgi:germacradienol/geosmin synthase
LDTYVEGLQRYMAGVLRWHQTVSRYHESELRADRVRGVRLNGPTGLGTAASQIGALPPWRRELVMVHLEMGANNE